MKNKLILGIVILLIAVGIIVFIKRTSAPASTAPILDSTTLGTSTLTSLGAGATASTTVRAAGNGADLTQKATTTPTTVDPSKEQKAGFSFTCDAQKSIQVTLYIGGKDPRADLLLIDNSTNPDGVPNEARRIILKQRAAATTGVKYATDKETIVFTSEGTKAQLIENGRIVFRNCNQVMDR